MPDITEPTNSTITLSLDAQNNLVMTDQDDHDVTTDFGVTKNATILFKAGQSFSISDFTDKIDKSSVVAPFVLQSPGTRQPSTGQPTTSTKYCSELTDGSYQLKIMVNGSGFGGKNYGFGVTIGGYDHDPEMDIESG